MISTLSDQIAEQVRRELAARRLSAAALAPVLGVGVQTAQRRVAGSRQFEINDLPTLARFFDIDIDVLTGKAA